MVNITDPGGIFRREDGVTPPISASVASGGRVHVDMIMSPAGYRMLEELAERSGQGIDDVVAKAFLLYRAALEAHKEGKAVGVAATADVLETEFVGL